MESKSVDRAAYIKPARLLIKIPVIVVVSTKDKSAAGRVKPQVCTAYHVPAEKAPIHTQEAMVIQPFLEQIYDTKKGEVKRIKLKTLIPDGFSVFEAISSMSKIKDKLKQRASMMLSTSSFRYSSISSCFG